VNARLLALVPLAAALLAGSAGPFDGHWKTSVTVAQLLHTAAPPTPALAEKLAGRYTMVFEKGRFEERNQRTSAIGRGTYTVHGNVARVVFASGVGVRRGQVSECTWNVYRGRLTFKAIAGRPSLLCDAAVWVRSG
jgi:hypothetical protein